MKYVLTGKVVAANFGGGKVQFQVDVLQPAPGGKIGDAVSVGHVTANVPRELLKGAAEADGREATVTIEIPEG